MYTWNVTPKTFTDEIGQSRTITGIQCSIVSPIQFDRNEDKEHTLYIAFVQETGIIYGERNATSTTFIQKMVDDGMSVKDATASVKSILKSLSFGTLEEMEASAGILAGLYGYSLAS
jgi:hypothetical protein